MNWDGLMHDLTVGAILIVLTSIATGLGFFLKKSYNRFVSIDCAAQSLPEIKLSMDKHQETLMEHNHRFEQHHARIASLEDWREDQQ